MRRTLIQFLLPLVFCLVPPFAAFTLGAWAVGASITALGPHLTAREAGAAVTRVGARVVVTVPSLADAARWW